jgi:hypothetical protein
MWSSIVADLVDRLIPDGGKGLLGKEKHCANVRLAPIATQDAAGLP